ncbi:MAG TPA: hypothetical protein VIT44_15660 [Cyclobacteriaceae bacterium]
MKLKKSGELLNAESFWFGYEDELNTNTLLSLNLGAEFENHSGFVKELDPIINDSDYHFSTGSNSHNPNNGIYYYTTTFASQSTYSFQAYVSNKWYYVYYSVATGELVGVKLNNQVLTGDDPIFIQFNKLKFVEDAGLNMPVFYTVEDDINLSVTVPDTAADLLIITNFSHNAATGVITFDFTLTVSRYRSFFNGTNSTNHDITITGKFNSGGKVYSSIVGRKG